jgi:hypothetical protein
MESVYRGEGLDGMDGMGWDGCENVENREGVKWRKRFNSFQFNSLSAYSCSCSCPSLYQRLRNRPRKEDESAVLTFVLYLHPIQPYPTTVLGFNSRFLLYSIV